MDSYGEALTRFKESPHHQGTSKQLQSNNFSFAACLRPCISLRFSASLLLCKIAILWPRKNPVSCFLPPFPIWKVPPDSSTSQDSFSNCNRCRISNRRLTLIVSDQLLQCLKRPSNLVERWLILTAPRNDSSCSNLIHTVPGSPQDVSPHVSYVSSWKTSTCTNCFTHVD